MSDDKPDEFNLPTRPKINPIDKRISTAVNISMSKWLLMYAVDLFPEFPT